MCAFLLWSAVFLAYVPSLSGDFMLDDRFNIVENPTLDRPSRWPSLFYDPEAATSHRLLSRQFYRPGVSLYYGLINAVGGRNPFWYHLASVLVHASNAALVFLIGLSLLSGGRRLPAFLGALLFALHPAQAGAVSYIGGAPTLLALGGSLATFFLYARGRRAWAAAAFAATLLFQESAAFLALFLPAYDYLERGPEGLDIRAAVRRWLPFLLILCVYVAARSLVLGRFAQVRPWGGGWAGHALLAVQGLWADVGMAAWPVRIRHCFGFELDGGLVFSSAWKALALACLPAAAWLGLRRRAAWALGLAWFVCALLPVSNVIPLAQLAASRFLYLPLAGLAFCAVWALSRSRHWAPAAAAATLALLAGLFSVDEQWSWDNEFAGDLRGYEAAPRDPCSRHGLARHYLDLRKYGEVEALERDVLEAGGASETRALAFERMGLVRMSQGRLREAEAYLRGALLCEPGSVSVPKLLELIRERTAPARRARPARRPSGA